MIETVAAAVSSHGRSASEGIDPRRDLPHSGPGARGLSHRVFEGSSILLRQASADDAGAIHHLITSHLDEGHLLPRPLGEIEVHASRFVVAVDEGEIVGCVDLAPLSRTVAEIRSLVVSDLARSAGVGRRLIDTLVARARVDGFERLCAFTHVPSFFVRLGFSLVPHEWLPEKIRTDCGSCRLFRKCGQYAVMRRLSRHG